MKAKNEANRYDKIFKENIEAVTMALVEKVLGIQVAHSEKLKDELPKTLERKPDQLLKLTDIQENTFVLHLEFQLADEEEMAERMLEYRALLKRKYKIPIQQYVFFLGDQQPRMATFIQEHKLYFAFELVWMARIDYNLFLTSTRPDEVVFAVLGNFGMDTPEMVAQKLIQRLSETSKSSLELDKHLEQLRILANLRTLKPFLEQIMESITKYIKPEDDFFYKKGEQLGIEKGKQLGIEKGEQLGIEKGKLEAKFAFVRKSLKEGNLTTKQIASFFEVSEELIEQLRKEM